MLEQVHPGQFPLGSPASRAAARALIAERRSGSKMVDMVLSMESSEQPIFYDWKSLPEGSYTRRSRIPAGMTFEDAELAVGLTPVRPGREYVRLWIDL